VDLLVAKKLGGLGRCAEDEYPSDFAILRQAAARLSWGRQFTEQVVRQALVVAIAFTGRAPHELTVADLDELDAAVDASPHIAAAQRFIHHKQTHGLRQLLYEAHIVDVPAPSRRAATSDATKLAHAVAAPEILRTMTAYLHNRSTQLRPGTITGIANDLACFGEFLAAYQPSITRLTELTRAHVEQFCTLARSRTYRGRRANGQTIGPAAAAHAIITLRCFLDDITAWGWAEAPARRLVFTSDIPRQPRALPRALPADVDTALMWNGSVNNDGAVL